MANEVEDPDIARQSTMQGVTDSLAQSGFELPEPPAFPMPKLHPSDLHSTDQALYAQKYVQFGVWESYCFNVLAHIDGWVVEDKAKLKRMDVKARLRARRTKIAGEKQSEKHISDTVEGSAPHMEVADRLQAWTQKRGIVNAKYEEAALGRGLFSRYVIVREGDRRMEGGRHF
jgi:hypothetical protein